MNISSKSCAIVFVITSLILVSASTSTVGSVWAQSRGNVMPVLHAYPQIKLFITPDEYHRGYYQVVISGENFEHFQNAKVGYSIKGDDEWFDDRLNAYFIGNNVLFGKFTGSARVHSSILNEDWGRDEIYAEVSVQGAGVFRSNTIRGYY